MSHGKRFSVRPSSEAIHWNNHSDRNCSKSYCGDLTVTANGSGAPAIVIYHTSRRVFVLLVLLLWNIDGWGPRGQTAAAVRSIRRGKGRDGWGNGACIRLAGSEGESSVETHARLCECRRIRCDCMHRRETSETRRKTAMQFGVKLGFWWLLQEESSAGEEAPFDGD